MRSDQDEFAKEGEPQGSDLAPAAPPDIDAPVIGKAEEGVDSKPDAPPVSGISAHKLATELADLTEAYPVRHGRRGDEHDVFIQIPCEDGRARWMECSDPRVERHLRAIGYRHLCRGPTRATIDAVLDHIRGRGFVEQAEPCVRRIHSTPEAIWLTLGPDSDLTIKITGDGWTLEDQAPVLFSHAPNASTWPVPERGGSIELLRQYWPNVTDADWPGLLGFIISVFMPTGGFPILILEGRQAVGKSMSTEILRALLDPVTGLDARAALPERAEDLYTIAAGSHFLSFDNLSNLTADTSDALCRISTGMARQARKLFTQGQVQTLRARCALVINGIVPGANREDLMSRAMSIELQKIPLERHRTECALRSEFRRDLPKILGVLFDAVAMAIGNHRQTTVISDFRLSDAAVFASAAEPALGLPDGAIVEAWMRLQQGATAEMSAVDPVASVLERLFRREDTGPSLSVTAAELVSQAVELERDGGAPLPADFPRSAAKLGSHLRRQEHTLAQAGFKVTKIRTASVRRIHIIKCDPIATATRVVVKRGVPKQNGGGSA